MNPDTLLNAVHVVLGISLFALGLSFAWKFYNAALSGKVEYWSGLQNFHVGLGYIFAPLTVLVSPLFCHLPYNPKNSLIATRQSLWVHIVFGPIFMLLSMMCMTSGADLVGLGLGNGGGASQSLNYVLTLGRSDVPPCIIYSPPMSSAYFDVGSYRFPFIKKATKKILRFICTTIPTDKKNSYNPYEKNGEEVSKYTKTGIPWIDEDDDDEVAPQVPINATAVTTRPAPKRSK